MNHTRLSLAEVQHRLQHAEHILAVLGYVWISGAGSPQPELASIDAVRERLEQAVHFLQDFGFVSTGDGNFSMPSEETISSPATVRDMAHAYNLHLAEQLILAAGYVPVGNGAFVMPPNKKTGRQRQAAEPGRLREHE